MSDTSALKQEIKAFIVKRLRLTDVSPESIGDADPLEVALDIDDEPITLSVQHGQLHADLGTAPHPDVRIACDGPTAAAILSGQLHLDAATRQDRAQINGTRTARARLAHLIDAGRVTQQRMVPGR